MPCAINKVTKVPYTIIVCDDGSLYGSNKRKIMQREKLVNELWFLVPPHFNGHDMSKCTLTMRYLLPISKEFRTEKLVLSEDGYEEYLKYVLPIDTVITREWGEIELNLTFTMLHVDDNGNVIQRVRKTDNHILNITKLPDWDSIIPDHALSALDWRILQQDIQINKLADLANVINNNQVDNLVYDNKSDTLQLYANGVGIGDKVSVRDMIDDGIPVVDLGSNSSEDSDNGNDDYECCKCEDGVVTF